MRDAQFLIKSQCQKASEHANIFQTLCFLSMIPEHGDNYCLMLLPILKSLSNPIKNCILVIPVLCSISLLWRYLAYFLPATNNPLVFSFCSAPDMHTCTCIHNSPRTKTTNCLFCHLYRYFVMHIFLM